MTLTSLLRDTLVQYPNYTDTNGKKHSGGKIKLTSIYHNGYICTNSTADAMGLMNQTLYSNFGIEVDYDVEIDFDAFIKAINLLGGINVELTAAEANYLNDFHDRYYYEVKEGKTGWTAPLPLPMSVCGRRRATAKATSSVPPVSVSLWRHCWPRSRR